VPCPVVRQHSCVRELRHLGGVQSHATRYVARTGRLPLCGPSWSDSICLTSNFPHLLARRVKSLQASGQTVMSDSSDRIFLTRLAALSVHHPSGHPATAGSKAHSYDERTIIESRSGSRMQRTRKFI